MKLFIDTGSVAEVEEIAAWGVLSGATTNPSLLAKEQDADPGRPPLQVAGPPGTGTAPAASEPTAPDPTRSSSSVSDLHDHKRQG